MEETLASTGWPSIATWGVFALGTILGWAAGTHRHMLSAYHRRRLERRLARDPYILREEMNEYLGAIGEEPEPLNWPRTIAAALLAGVVFAGPIWFAEQNLEHLWELGLITLGVLSLLGAWWRWMNDPDSDPNVLKLPDAEIPREAITGFVAALGVVALILVAVAWLF